MVWKALEDIRKEAEETQAHLQSKNYAYYNARRKNATELREGDFVMVKNFDSTVGVA